MELNERLLRFRLASRGLFNHYFFIPGARDEMAWRAVERFRTVEELMFRMLVTEPLSLPSTSYGNMQAEILVLLRETLDHAPILINREVKSGYWDHPLSEVTGNARLAFMSFFDWDDLSYRDNQYTRAQVLAWPEHPETLGKHVLIESQYVRFISVSESSTAKGKPV